MRTSRIVWRTESWSGHNRRLCIDQPTRWANGGSARQSPFAPAAPSGCLSLARRRGAVGEPLPRHVAPAPIASHHPPECLEPEEQRELTIPERFHDTRQQQLHAVAPPCITTEAHFLEEDGPHRKKHSV